MGILGKWFGHKEAAAGKAPPSATAAHAVGYDPALIAQLAGEHQALLAHYLRIGQLMRAGDFNALPAELEAFRQLLLEHTRFENVHFYTYLEQHLRDDNASTMRDFRREMNSIARSAASFATRYQAPGQLDPPQRPGFSRDYAGVGALLAKRVKREEADLFPLYRPD